MGIIKAIFNIFRSLRMANILLFILMGTMVIGAIVMPLFPSYRRINTTSLFSWLSVTPLRETWWLYIAILIVALLVINTIFCTVEALIKKDRNRRWPLVISPQLIHLGFAFIMLAHLLSSYMAMQGFVMLNEGGGIRFSNGDTLYLKRIEYQLQRGYITDMKAEIAYSDNRGITKRLISAPNRPAFIRGTGVYLKDVEVMPARRALLQISYDPGARWALVGGIFFIIGTTLLVILKIRQEAV